MRLIDADALKAKQQEDADIFLSPIPNPINKIRRDEALNAVANIVNAPTIDAVPVEEFCAWLKTHGCNVLEQVLRANIKLFREKGEE